MAVAFDFIAVLVVLLGAGAQMIGAVARSRDDSLDWLPLRASRLAQDGVGVMISAIGTVIWIGATAHAVSVDYWGLLLAISIVAMIVVFFCGLVLRGSSRRAGTADDQDPELHKEAD
jgi:hypothetical protein